MGHHDLTDREYGLLEDLLNYTPTRGAKPKRVRETFNAILWIICTGSPWRDLPEQYPAWKTVYDRFRVYATQGIITTALERLMLHSDEERRRILAEVEGDATYMRAQQYAAGRGVKKGKGKRAKRGGGRREAVALGRR